MMSPTEQLRILADGAEHLLPADELERKLTLAVRGERPPLRAKLGLDPTRPDLHLGHSVPLRKLRDFQRLGHTAVIIIGGFTAQVGDPSGRSAARARMTAHQVAANAQSYLDQVRRVLLPEPLEVVDNADWLSPMTLPDVLGLTAQMTVARMLERHDFGARFRAGRPIAILEFLYPLLQGQDSVAVHADVELGGTDQLFNLMVGRDLQMAAGQEPQCVLTLPLLEGLDGVEKMSKTADNWIGVTEDPVEMFGKTMSLPDPMMERWFRLLTDLSPDEVDALRDDLATGRVRPVDAKRRLAREIVTLYHDAAAADLAEARFDVVFRDHQVPEGIAEHRLSVAARQFLPTLLQEAGLVASGSEARRLVGQGAVRLDGDVLRDATAELATDAMRGRVLQVGKRRFTRLM